MERATATPKYVTPSLIKKERGKKKMAVFKLIAIGILGLFAFAAGMAYYGYESAIYPIDKALGNLARAESSQTPEELAAYVYEAKRTLPPSGNPVWSFPTAKTDFGLIQQDLDMILSRANSIASVEPHSSAYSTGMADMHLSLQSIQGNIVEAMPYMYVSTTNVAVSVVWIAIIIGLFAVMRRGRSKYQEYQSP